MTTKKEIRPAELPFRFPRAGALWRTFTSSGLIRRAGLSTGLAIGATEAIVAANSLRPVKFSTKSSSEHTTENQSYAPITVPESLSEELKTDLEDYSAVKGTLPDAVQSTLNSGDTATGYIPKNEKLALEGTWVIPEQSGIPEHHIHIACTGGHDCQVWFRYGTGTPGGPWIYKMSTLYFDPNNLDNKKQAWGVLPLFSEFVRTRGTCLPYYVSARAVTDHEQKDVLEMYYFSQKGDLLLLKTHWPRHTPKPGVALQKLGWE